MPFEFRRCLFARPGVRGVALIALAALLAGGLTQTPAAQTTATSPVAADADNSGLDAQLFYQLLIGELQLREGDAGTAYGIILDAAQRTGNDQLFQRAADIALQARAGEQALDAALAWRKLRPDTLDAHRYVVQLLVALDRLDEVSTALTRLLQATPVRERPSAIAALPRFFARWPDQAQAARVVEAVVKPYVEAPFLGAPSWVAIGRARINAGEFETALEAARSAQAMDLTAAGPALLGVELVRPYPHEAHSLVHAFMAAEDNHVPVQQAYVRALIGAQRYEDAQRELLDLTTRRPELADPWLLKGALEVEARQPSQALVSLQRYLEVSAQGGATDDSPQGNGASGEDSDADPAETGRVQAYLNLARASEQLGDTAQAEQWLSRIEDAPGRLNVQLQRAQLIARQGDVDKARRLIQAVPERTMQDARAKLVAEAQLLRTVSDWQGAYAVISQAVTRFPNDPDLLYEQAMMAERLDRLDEMEQLLRQIIQDHPDYYHAYNALGYTLADRNQRLPEARELIIKALELAPGDPFITDSLGWVEFRLGNYGEALRLLQDAYRDRPDAEIGAHLGEVLWTMGQRAEALRVWRDAQQRNADNQTLKDTLQRLGVSL